MLQSGALSLAFRAFGLISCVVLSVDEGQPIFWTQHYLGGFRCCVIPKEAVANTHYGFLRGHKLSLLLVKQQKQNGWMRGQGLAERYRKLGHRFPK